MNISELSLISCLANVVLLVAIIIFWKFWLWPRLTSVCHKSAALYFIRHAMQLHLYGHSLADVWVNRFFHAMAVLLTMVFAI